jgi:hypothetical protein
VYKQQKQYSTSCNKIGKREQQILIDIKEELKQNEAIIIKAHTGNSIIIIKERDCIVNSTSSLMKITLHMQVLIMPINFRQLLGKT